MTDNNPGHRERDSEVSLSSAGPAQPGPIRKTRVTVWLQRQGKSGTDPEGGGPKARGRASVREAPLAAASGGPLEPGPGPAPCTLWDGGSAA